jgi:4-amino-4-deoxy-L-arabinose transferase-like glycosyltransferase
LRLDDSRAALGLLLLFSVGLRVGMALFLGTNLAGDPGTADQVSYHTLALRLLGGHGFTFGENWWPMTHAGQPTAHWSYLYTAALALVYRLLGPSPLGPRLIQAVLTGIALPWLTLAITRTLFGARAGWVAAVLTALYAYFIYYAPALMTESFYLVAVLAMLLLAIRLAQALAGAPPGSRRAYRIGLAVALGVVIAVAALLRQVILLFVPFLLAWIGWTARRAGLARAVRHLAVTLAVLVLAILPVTLFNVQRFGQFVLLNTNAGFAFYWANHPIYGTHFQPILSPDTASYGELIPQELRGLNEAALDRELLRRGLGFVAADPLRYLLLSASRLPAYFMFWPSPASSTISNLARVGSFGLLGPLMLYGVLLVGLNRLPGGRPRPAGAVLLLLFVAVYSLIHLLSWSLIRYRLPVDAVLLPFAGLACVDLAERLSRRLLSAGGRGAPLQESERTNGMANLLHSDL